MNRRIENFIPTAIKAAEQHLATNGKIKSEYNGYISSFGAAVMQSGLKAAVAFNESTNSSSNEDKDLLMKAILQTVLRRPVERNERLLDYILNNNRIESQLKIQIMDAAVALKLAIRTFELTKGE